MRLTTEEAILNIAEQFTFLGISFHEITLNSMLWYQLEKDLGSQIIYFEDGSIRLVGITNYIKILRDPQVT